MGRLRGKVAMITGAARGQGRCHALRMAKEGADIIALDICDQIPTLAYGLATEEDLEETVRLVENEGRRIVARKADVRDPDAVRASYQAGTRQLGPVDIVVANAGVAPQVHATTDEWAAFHDIIGTNLTGVWNTVRVAANDMIQRGAGGSIVITSSTLGLSGRGGDGGGATLAYAASKHGVVGIMRSLANWLGPHGIRVNTVHPTGTETPMITNDFIDEWIRTDPAIASQVANLMPVPMVAPDDIANAVLFLASDDGRFVTGVTLPVDAGYCAK